MLYLHYTPVAFAPWHENDIGHRRGSTPVSTVSRKSVRFFIINNSLILKNTFQGETWAISCLNDAKTQERGLKELKTQKCLGGSYPPPGPLKIMLAPSALAQEIGQYLSQILSSGMPSVFTRYEKGDFGEILYNAYNRTKLHRDDLESRSSNSG